MKSLKRFLLLLLLLPNIALAQYSLDLEDDEAANLYFTFSFMFMQPSVNIPNFYLPMLPPKPQNKVPEKALPPAVNYSNGSEVGCKAGPSTNNPVMIATGEKYKTERDFTSGSLYGFGLERTYRSIHATGTMFGPNWLSSLDGDRMVHSEYFEPKKNWPGAPRTVTIITATGLKLPYAYTGAFVDRNASAPQETSNTYNIPLIPVVPEAYIYSIPGSAVTGDLIYTVGEGWYLTRGNKIYRYGNNLQLQTVTDGAGNTLTYTYSATGKPRLEKITNGVGQSVHFTWGANDRVAEVRDPAGNTWSYEYNTKGMLVKVTAPVSLAAPADVREYHYEHGHWELLTGVTIGGKRQSRFEYDHHKRTFESGLTGNLERERFTYDPAYMYAHLDNTSTRVSHWSGDETTYKFKNVLGNLKIESVSRAASASCVGANATTAYDPNGHVDYTLDFNGNKTDYSYDHLGRLTETTTAAGTKDAMTTSTVWSGSQVSETTYKDAAANAYARIAYAYHASGRERGRLADMTHTDLRTGAQRRAVYAYQFYAKGTLAAVTATQLVPGGDIVTVVKFDEAGNVRSMTNPLNQTLTWSDYTALGMPGKLVNANGVATSYFYNPNGTLERMVESGDRVTSYVYNAAQQPTSISYPDGSVARYTYADSGRLEAIGNAPGEFLRLGVDPNRPGHRRHTSSSTRHIASMGLGGPAASESGQFSSTTEVDTVGRPYTVLGNHGQRVDIRYHSNGNIASHANAAGHTISYEFDAQNRLVKTTSPDGVTQLSYNGAGQLEEVVDPRGLRTTYTHNAFGDVTSISSPDTGVTTYDPYDAAGRLLSEKRNDGKVFNYTWDSLGRPLSRQSGAGIERYNYDEGQYGKGHLTSFSDSTGRTDYLYNAAGQLLRQNNDIYGIKLTTGWEYDQAGRLSGMGYPTGLILSYHYDSFGRLEEIKSSVGGKWKTLASTFLYQPATDQLYAWRFGNGLPRIATFDTDGRVEQLASAGVHDLVFGYHAVDTIESVTNKLYPTLTAAYGYDPSARLTTVRRSGDNQDFAHDAGGNRRHHARELQGYYDIKVDAGSNRLVTWTDGTKSRSFHYNLAGNLEVEYHNDGNRSYGFDAFNRVNGAYANGVMVGDYRNNAFSQRVYKIAKGAMCPSNVGFLDNRSRQQLSAEMPGARRPGTQSIKLVPGTAKINEFLEYFQLQLFLVRTAGMQVGPIKCRFIRS